MFSAIPGATPQDIGRISNPARMILNAESFTKSYSGKPDQHFVAYLVHRHSNGQTDCFVYVARTHPSFLLFLDLSFPCDGQVYLELKLHEDPIWQRFEREVLGAARRLDCIEL